MTGRPPRPVAVVRPPGPSDRPAPGLAPDWRAEEERVLGMLAEHTAETDPWQAAVAVFGEQPPQRRRGRTIAAVLRSAVDAITTAQRRPATGHPPREPQRSQEARK